ncbi:MAG: glycosyltransferase N-terminal domain-containing protein [Pseudomonadota bacterium]
MVRSVTIASYLINLGQPGGRDAPYSFPKRPEGTIIWARCSTSDQLQAIETLGRRLSADGDPVRVIATLHRWDPDMAGRAMPEPQGRDTIRAFIQHWRPSMVVWVRGDLDMLMLAEIDGAGIASILVDATSGGIDHVAGSWVPGALRSVLGQFDAVLALDQQAADTLMQAGAPSENMLVTGPMADTVPTLPCSEEERQEIAQAIGTRPVWLAAGAHLDEWAELCEAQQEASHRAHRLLLIVVPQNPVIASTIAEHMQNAGFRVGLRSRDPLPDDVTEIFIVDADDELGLWYRISPITYVGGTLHGGGCRDPFEATSVGSAVLYGPQVKPFERHAARLNAAGASRLLRGAGDLGPAVESLLAADKTAALAHAAWDVTSRGAAVTNRIATYIQTRLEELAS